MAVSPASSSRTQSPVEEEDDRVKPVDRREPTEEDALLPKDPAAAGDADEEVHAGNGTAAAAADGPKVPVPRIGLILPALAVGVFMSAMDNTIVVSSYGKIGSDLKGLNRTSWIATAYMLTITSFQPLYGKLSDIFGRKASLLFAYTIFGLGCLGCGLSRTMGELIGARAFAGIGGGGMTTVVSILMSDIVPLRQRGTWQGIINIIFALGAATGAPLGGILSDTIGWRWSFLIQCPATLLAIISVSILLHLPSTHATESHLWDRFKRIDFVGAFVLIGATFCLLIGLDRGGNFGFNDKVVIGTLCGSVGLFVIFAAVEARFAAEPFAPPRIVLDRTVFSACMANFFAFGSYMSVIYYLPLLWQAVESKSASEAGMRLLPSILCSVAGSLGGGLLMQKTGKYYWLTVLAYSFATVGSIITLLCSGTVVEAIIGAMVGLCCQAVGNGIGVTSTLIGLIASAGPKDQAVATATSYLFRALGTVSGVSLSSALVQGRLRTMLEEVLTGEDAAETIERVRGSLDSIKALPPDTRVVVVECYEKAVRAAFVFGVCFIFLAAVSSTFMKEKKLSR